MKFEGKKTGYIELFIFKYEHDPILDLKWPLRSNLILRKKLCLYNVIIHKKVIRSDFRQNIITFPYYYTDLKRI